MERAGSAVRRARPNHASGGGARQAGHGGQQTPRPQRLVRTGDFQIRAGLKQTKDLMRLPDPPTAIFACNDGQALGAYWAAEELKLRIPDDLSVIGFDDMPAMRWAIPPLTTIRQPLTEMGQVAATMLLALAEGEPPTQNRVELGTELIVRGSTAPVRLP